MQITDTRQLRILVEDKDLDIHTLTAVAGATENEVKGILDGTMVSASVLPDVLNAARSMPSRRDDEYLFKRRIEFIRAYNDYKEPDPIKGYAVTNKNHIVHHFITQDLAKGIKNYLTLSRAEGYEHIDVVGSTGDGRVGASFWVALLDNRITTSTRDGLYVVLLFNDTGEKLYVTIASGTEKKTLTEIRNETAKRRRVFKRLISENQYLHDYIADTIELGKTERAIKFGESVCVCKEFSIYEVNEQLLFQSIDTLNNLFYEYLFTVFLSESEEDAPVSGTDTNASKPRTRRKISRDKHKELLRNRDEFREKIGIAAEEHVLAEEVRTLRSAGRSDLAEKVDWVAKEFDGLGYDIHSFFHDGSDKLIEVKGSSLSNSDFEFYLSKRECDVAKEKGDNYVIALVENVTKPNIRTVAELRNPFGVGETSFSSEPISYRCKYKI